jgi:hypothetical protein
VCFVEDFLDPSTDLEANKTTVTAFYDLMSNQWQPAEAIRRYVGAAANLNTMSDPRRGARRFPSRFRSLPGVRV